jgi:hypothetical protein
MLYIDSVHPATWQDFVNLIILRLWLVFLNYVKWPRH